MIRIWILFLLVIVVNPCLAQDLQIEIAQSVKYKKTVTEAGKFDTQSVEALFSEGSHSRAEFIYLQSFRMERALILSVDSVGNNLLVARQISNKREVDSLVQVKYPVLGTTNFDELEKLALHNSEMMKKQFIEKLNSYIISSDSVIISNQLADQIYFAIKSAIDSASEECLRNVIVFDGEVSIFRYTAEGKTYSLRYHIPEDVFHTLTDVFIKVISELQCDQFDQQEYIVKF